jgi:DNA-binding transcriptional LysR family regulator
MDIRPLRAFVEVVRQGGFSRAAKSVFTTQSSVSKAVKQLEDELGLALLDRAGHRATLTEAGEVVYRRALVVLAELDDLTAELDEVRGLARGVLRLGLPMVGSSTLFAPLFALYRSRYPGVDIRLVEHGSKRLEELLLAGEVDLGALLLPVDKRFEWQEVRLEPIDALIHADHPLAARGSVGLADLAELDFILFGQEFALNPIILEACQRSGFTPNIVARSSQIDFIIELVAARLGVGFLPRMIAGSNGNPAIRRLAVSPTMHWHLAMSWRRGGYLSHAAKAWLDLARELAGPDRAQGAD